MIYYCPVLLLPLLLFLISSLCPHLLTCPLKMLLDFRSQQDRLDVTFPRQSLGSHAMLALRSQNIKHLVNFYADHYFIVAIQHQQLLAFH